jgi:hypothetical protein
LSAIRKFRPGADRLATTPQTPNFRIAVIQQRIATRSTESRGSADCLKTPEQLLELSLGATACKSPEQPGDYNNQAGHDDGALKRLQGCGGTAMQKVNADPS